MKSHLDRNALFQKTLRTVPAYSDFIHKSGVKLRAIKSESDWLKLPVMDKKNYLARYPRKKIFPGGVFPAVISASSGSSGSPTFWFRGDEQERMGGETHEIIFRDIFGIGKNDETLVVVCFGMGIWVAGQFTLASCKYLSRNGYRISTITPGIEKEDILRIMANLAPEYKNVVLAGYPPFVMDVLTEMDKRKIAFPKRLRILTAGDKFSEEWRDAVAELSGIRDGTKNIVSVYGSADAAVLGYDTPASVFIRRVAASSNMEFYKSLFGNEPNLPGLVQYDPRFIFFEEIKGELALTAPTAAPLIRYNIHDRGNVITRSAMEELLRTNHLLNPAMKCGFGLFKSPFLALNGRSDVAVTFYAINIYPEHIKHCLDCIPLSRIATGNYLAFNRTVRHEKDQRLYFHFELKKEARVTRKQAVAVAKAVTKGLHAVNTEFRKLFASIGTRALPRVRIVPHGALRMPSRAKRGLLSTGGKKARMVIS